jgi:hemolysin activation/secretion protein
MKIHASLLVALFAGAFASAQVAPPDAGQLLRDQAPPAERKPSQRLPENDVPIVTQAPAAPAGATVMVKGFRFRGQEGLATDAELDQLLRDAIGTSADVAGLQRLADRVTTMLRSKGYFLARAYLPKQDVTSGVIEIAVIQARSDGGISINRAPGVRIDQDRLQHMVDLVIKPGEPLRERDLERALLLLNDLPGVTARAVLAPGTQPGTTHITINASESKRFSGSVWADNHGNRYTGAWRGNGLLSVSDPFGFGDQFSVMASGAEGLAQGRIAYDAPIGRHGLRGDLSYTGMQYELGDGLSSLKAKGTAQTFHAGASYPLIRRRSFSLSANVGYEFKGLIDKAYGFTIRDKTLHSGTLAITGDHSDAFAGGGYTTGTLSFSGGNLDLSGNRVDALADKAGPRAAGTYSRFNLSASRLQQLPIGLMFLTSYSGQYAQKNLDSSEKFSLGGPYGVRAFPVGEASGDEGHLFNFELRKQLARGWKWGTLQMLGFVDAGHITLEKSPWTLTAPNKTGENSYWLSGTGLGLNLSQPGRYSLRLTYAYKLGDNPGRSFTGMDADGRNSDGRVWAMAQFSY